MLEKRFLWLLLIVSSVSAQIKGIVVDASGKPIPYVNIWVENLCIGTTSEENGQFEINFSDKTKNLIFSSLGFETKKVLASDAGKVVLQSQVIGLDEVVVLKSKKTREIEIGNFKKAFYLPEPQQTPWIFGRTIFPDKNNKDLKFIKSIVYYTKSEVKEGIFRVRLFSVTKDGVPDADLIQDEIIIKVKKGKHKAVVDVSAYGLEIPEEGVFVGFESLLTEGNKYTQKAFNPKDRKTVTYQDYSPRILYNYIDTEDSYCCRAGVWTQQLFRWFAEPGKEKRVIAPAINLILTD